METKHAGPKKIGREASETPPPAPTLSERSDFSSDIGNSGSCTLRRDVYNFLSDLWLRFSYTCASLQRVLTYFLSGTNPETFYDVYPYRYVSFFFFLNSFSIVRMHKADRKRKRASFPSSSSKIVNLGYLQRSHFLPTEKFNDQTKNRGNGFLPCRATRL